jgi:hypothetical protein
MGLAIGVDIGGTKVAAGLVDDDGRILSRLRHDTPAHDPAATEDVIADCIQALAAEHQVEAAGLGAAGFVDAARSTVLFAPNLAWRNLPIAQRMRDALVASLHFDIFHRHARSREALEVLRTEELELVRQGYELWNRGDFEGVAELCFADDLVWQNAPEWPGTRTYRATRRSSRFCATTWRACRRG